MKRVVFLLVMILSLATFAHGSMAGGADPDAGWFANAGCPSALTESQRDGSGLAATCALPCTLCVAALDAIENWHADYGDSRADCPFAMVNQDVAEILYRPPKSRPG